MKKLGSGNARAVIHENQGRQNQRAGKYKINPTQKLLPLSVGFFIPRHPM